MAAVAAVAPAEFSDRLQTSSHICTQPRHTFLTEGGLVGRGSVLGPCQRNLFTAGGELVFVCALLTQFSSPVEAAEVTGKIWRSYRNNQSGSLSHSLWALSVHRVLEILLFTSTEDIPEHKHSTSRLSLLSVYDTIEKNDKHFPYSI